MISESHPLRTFFREVVQRNYDQGVGLRDRDMIVYISDLLTAFVEVEQLYKVRNVAGKPLEDVGELLLESDPVFGAAPSFGREREVRKHIGDFTLFFTGMFPESLNRWRMRRYRLESFVDLVKAGKESYYIVSKFEHFEYAAEAPLFAKLSDEFERCVYGLNMVKGELQERQHPIVRRAQDILM